MVMRCPAFESLIKDMKKNEIDKEHYSFVYNGFQFDTILSIVTGGYEILVAIHTHNWGCVLKMDDDFIVDMPDNKYFELCRILKLNYAEDGFNSSKFLKMLSEKAPKHSNRQGVEYISVVGMIIQEIIEEHVILTKRNFILVKRWQTIVVSIVLVHCGLIILVMK